jgi:hypothetical protein
LIFDSRSEYYHVCTDAAVVDLRNTANLLRNRAAGQYIFVYPGAEIGRFQHIPVRGFADGPQFRPPYRLLAALQAVILPKSFYSKTGSEILSEELGKAPGSGLAINSLHMLSDRIDRELHLVGHLLVGIAEEH